MSLNNNNNKKAMAILKQIIFALFLRKFPNELMAERSYERGTISAVSSRLAECTPQVQTTAAKSPAKLRKLMPSQTLTSCRYNGGDT